MKAQATKRKGFTLVELIIVIAILAILATVGIQIYGGIQENSRVTTAQTNADTLASAINTFHVVNQVTPGTLTPLELKAFMNPANDGKAVKMNNQGAWWSDLKNSTAGVFGAITTDATTFVPASYASATTASTFGEGELQALSNIWYDATTKAYKAMKKDSILVIPPTGYTGATFLTTEVRA
ncbi:hypothetical protein FACS1894217_15540 [Clostridia bacterium]|nr:hypothetical protein FACS1894217_15540 [Clostridia bacterium]